MYTKDFPDHHDAELVLRLYELRREPVMRESRHVINRTFWPTSLDDVLAVVKSGDHPLNAAFRQTSTYWEMVYGMAKHGIVHTDFLLESSGEGLYLYARVEPYLEAYRQAMSPRAFVNAEWVATNSDMGRQLSAHFRNRVQQMLAKQ
jgi:hypothetical protein